MEATMSFNVIYPNREGARFDTHYYRETHIPLVQRIFHPARVTLIEGVPMGGAAPPFVMIAHFEFASLGALNAALSAPDRGALRADLANFTDIEPTILLGKQCSGPK
ncbi:EthD family reductase [Massilia arenosa]|uniref:EthD family reductase n=1 Tax=Zemynaea arenosa TaxID=2561931 RepID=A0A4Y9S801_9BURK|nr:EthD family reductase [Massilia arenosa]TFW17610.1 EthD family reductase [Massilia arenosa]